MNNYRDIGEFTAEQNKSAFCRYRLGASKDFRATGFGQAGFQNVLCIFKASQTMLGTAIFSIFYAKFSIF